MTDNFSLVLAIVFCSPLRSASSKIMIKSSTKFCCTKSTILERGNFCAPPIGPSTSIRLYFFLSYFMKIFIFPVLFPGIIKELYVALVKPDIFMLRQFGTIYVYPIGIISIISKSASGLLFAMYCDVTNEVCPSPISKIYAGLMLSKILNSV